MKIKVHHEIRVEVELERGEWTMKANNWSIASISFTVRVKRDGTWGVRINHSDFKAYERRWAIKDRVAFLPTKKFPGFYASREDLPSFVVTALYDTYSAWISTLPQLFPPIDEGKWAE